MTPLTAQNVEDFLKSHFSSALAARNMTAADFTGELDLLKEGIVDSLGVIEMISAVEQHFRVSVDFEQMDPAELTILGKFSEFVAAHAVSSAS